MLIMLLCYSQFTFSCVHEGLICVEVCWWLQAIVITQVLGSLIRVEEFVVSIYNVSYHCVFKFSDYLVFPVSFYKDPCNSENNLAKAGRCQLIHVVGE